MATVNKSRNCYCAVCYAEGCRKWMQELQQAIQRWPLGVVPAMRRPHLHLQPEVQKSVGTYAYVLLPPCRQVRSVFLPPPLPPLPTPHHRPLPPFPVLTQKAHYNWKEAVFPPSSACPKPHAHISLSTFFLLHKILCQRKSQREFEQFLD